MRGNLLSTVKWPEVVTITITNADIDAAKGCNPNRCGIHVATKRAVGGHGYVRVDATGVAVTRRSDFREKAFLSKPLAKWLITFDLWSKGLGPRPKPITAKLRFHKTTRIVKRDRDEINAARQARKANGWKEPRYDIASRVIGISVAQKKKRAA